MLAAFPRCTAKLRRCFGMFVARAFPDTSVICLPVARIKRPASTASGMKMSSRHNVENFLLFSAKEANTCRLSVVRRAGCFNKRCRRRWSPKRGDAHWSMASVSCHPIIVTTQVVGFEGSADDVVSLGMACKSTCVKFAT